MVDVKCDWCGKTMHRSPRKERIAKKHFCNRDHYVKHKKEHNYYGHVTETKTYQKIQKLANEMKRKNGE